MVDKIERNEFVDEERCYKRIIDVGGRNKWIKIIGNKLKERKSWNINIKKSHSPLP